MSPTRPPFLTAVVTMTALTALLWVMEALDVASGHRLDGLGVQARNPGDLWSIVTMPLAHANWTHLMANTLPFLILGLMVLATSTWREFGLGLIVIVAASGFAAWLLSGTHTNTLGASGVIFGWLTYLLVRGLYSRKVGQILLAVLVFLMFGAVLWGVLPSNAGVSWQGHLGGAIGGILAARWLHRRQPTPPTVT